MGYNNGNKRIFKDNFLGQNRIIYRIQIQDDKEDSDIPTETNKRDLTLLFFGERIWGGIGVQTVHQGGRTYQLGIPSAESQHSLTHGRGVHVTPCHRLLLQTGKRAASQHTRGDEVFLRHGDNLTLHPEIRAISQAQGLLWHQRSHRRPHTTDGQAQDGKLSRATEQRAQRRHSQEAHR